MSNENLNITDRKEYKFKNGLEVYQEELDTEQFHDIMCLLSKVEITSPDELMNLSINKVISILKTKNILSDFLRIILRCGDNEKIDEAFNVNLKLSELMEVLKDFFHINPVVQLLSSGFGKIQDSGLLNTIISNLEPKQNQNIRTS